MNPKAMTAISVNGRSVTVRINDRGPYATGRVIDLTPGAARVLSVDGLARCRCRSIDAQANYTAPDERLGICGPQSGARRASPADAVALRALRPCGQSPGRDALIVFMARQTVKLPIKRNNFFDGHALEAIPSHPNPLIPTRFRASKSFVSPNSVRPTSQPPACP
jgi:hypothetical protein